MSDGGNIAFFPLRNTVSSSHSSADTTLGMTRREIRVSMALQGLVCITEALAKKCAVTELRTCSVVGPAVFYRIGYMKHGMEEVYEIDGTPFTTPYNFANFTKFVATAVQIINSISMPSKNEPKKKYIFFR